MEVNKNVSLKDALKMSKHHESVLRTTDVDHKPLAWLYEYECLCYYNSIIINRNKKQKEDGKLETHSGTLEN